MSLHTISADEAIDTDLPTHIGKYRVLKKLGEGATSDVFLAHDDFHRQPRHEGHHPF